MHREMKAYEWVPGSLITKLFTGNKAEASSQYNAIPQLDQYNIGPLKLSDKTHRVFEVLVTGQDGKVNRHE